MKPTISAHGTRARYTLGCRCQPCTDANATYGREWRHRTGRNKPRVYGRTHGLIGTYIDGCRCTDCRETARVAKASQRARAKERAAQ